MVCWCPYVPYADRAGLCLKGVSLWDIKIFCVTILIYKNYTFKKSEGENPASCLLIILTDEMKYVKNSLYTFSVNDYFIEQSVSAAHPAGITSHTELLMPSHLSPEAASLLSQVRRYHIFMSIVIEFQRMTHTCDKKLCFVYYSTL